MANDKTAGQIVDIGPREYKEIPAVKDMLEAELDSLQDEDLKKVIAAGTILLQRRSGKKIYTPEEITQIADSGVSAVKTVYKVGTGELDPTKATDILVDAAAAQTATVVKRTCETVGESLGTKVGIVIGKVFGPAGATIGAKIGGIVGKLGGRLVGEVIVPAVKTVAKVAKTVVKTAWEGVKTVAGAVWEGVKSIGRKFATWFGF
jgi:hypothetical protein